MLTRRGFLAAVAKFANADEFSREHFSVFLNQDRSSIGQMS